MDFNALTDSGVCKNIIVSSNDIGTDTQMLDIGISSIELFRKHIRESSTILWNGPVGLFEKSPFDFGTRSLGEEIGHLSKEGKIVSIVGGGDTLFAMNKCNVSQFLTYKSTSGGAFLTYLEGSELPGISAMEDPFILAE
jgi:phosphoglycerate kinase